MATENVFALDHRAVVYGVTRDPGKQHAYASAWTDRALCGKRAVQKFTYAKEQTWVPLCPKCAEKVGVA